MLRFQHALRLSAASKVGGGGATAAPSASSSSSSSAGRIPLATAVGIAKSSSVVLNSTLTHRPTHEELGKRNRLMCDESDKGTPTESKKSREQTAQQKTLTPSQEEVRMLVEKLLLSNYSPESNNTAAVGEQVSSARISGIVEWMRVVSTPSSPPEFSSSSHSTGEACVGALREALPSTSEVLLPAALHRAQSVLQICLSFDTVYTPLTETRDAEGKVTVKPTAGSSSAKSASGAINEKGHIMVMCPLSIPPTDAEKFYGIERLAGDRVTASSTSSASGLANGFNGIPPKPYPFLSVGARVLVHGRLRTSQKLLGVRGIGGMDDDENESVKTEGKGSPESGLRLMTMPVSFVQLPLDGVCTSVRLLPTF